MGTGCHSVASSYDDMPQELDQASFEAMPELNEQYPLFVMIRDDIRGIVQP